jgi:feruloyl esterase
VQVSAVETIAAGGFAPPAGTRVDAAAASLYRSLPAFCRVTAVITPVPGSTIGAEVWLPAQRWNGNLQAVGNRGWGGAISYAALAAAVADGYVSASTDTGHRGGGAAFALEGHERVVDAGDRAVHETTLIAKRLIAEVYGRPAARAYWNGCSLGGRQGLAEVQRHPADYDGVVVGDPASNLVDLYAARVMQARTVHRSAESMLPPPLFAALHRATLDACDATDGVRDGVIEDPRQCRPDPDRLRCGAPSADAAACLSGEQVETVRRLYQPVLHPSSRRVLSQGLMPGSEAGWQAVAGAQPENNALGLFRYLVTGDPEWDWRAPDLATLIDRATATLSPILDAVDPDLRSFAQRGGRLLIYHGWSDPQTPPGNTIDYYQRVQEKLGSAAADTVQLFMVPGMGHCEGGAGTDTFDQVAALDRWVTTGQPPARIEASRVVDGVVVKRRPLCRFGTVAAWDGRGDPSQTTSFSCATLPHGGTGSDR